MDQTGNSPRERGRGGAEPSPVTGGEPTRWTGAGAGRVPEVPREPAGAPAAAAPAAVAVLAPVMPLALVVVPDEECAVPRAVPPL